MSVCSRGQSEVIGIVLLTGVVTILVVGTGAVVLSDMSATGDRSIAQFESDVTAKTITLDYLGGDRIPTEDVVVILRGPTEKRLNFETAFTQQRGSNTTVLAPGEMWRASNPITSGTVDLLVVHTETKTVLHEARYTIGQDGVVLDIAGESDSATLTDGETVDYTVTRTYRRASPETITGTATVTSSDGSTVSVDTSTQTVTGESGGTASVTASDNGFSDTVDVTVESATASFAVSVSETNSPVVKGQTLWVNGTVTNTGGTGDTQTISLKAFDGNVVDQQSSVTLAGGQQTTFNLSWNTDQTGTDTVTVTSDDDSTSKTVTVKQPAVFDVQINNTNSPVVKGQTLWVNGTVINTGGTGDTQTISLKAFDGNVVDQQSSVTLGDGQQTTFNLSWNTDQTGTDAVTVTSDDDSQQQSVTVTESVFFDVNITQTNSPVTNGQTLWVNGTVNNTGGGSDTQTIKLYDFDGNVVGQTSVSLGGGSETMFNLTWTTDTTGKQNVSVASEDDTSKQKVEVLKQVTPPANAVAFLDKDETGTLSPGEPTYKASELSSIDVTGSFIVFADARASSVDISATKITLRSSVTLESTSGLTLAASDQTALDGSTILASNNLDVTTSSGILNATGTTFKTTFDGDITLDSAGDVNLDSAKTRATGFWNAPGSVTVSADGQISADSSSLESDSGLSLSAGETVSAADATLDVPDKITVTATGAVLDRSDVLTDNGDINVTTTSGKLTANSSSFKVSNNGNVVLDAAGDMQIESATLSPTSGWFTGGKATVTAGGSLSADSLTVSASEAVTITATGALSADQSSIDTGNKITVTAQTDMSLNQSSISTDDGNIELTTATGDLTAANTDLNVTDGFAVTVDSGGDLVVTGGDVTVSNTYDYGDGSVTFEADGAVRSDSLTVDAYKNVTLTAGTSLTADEATIETEGSGEGTVKLTATNGQLRANSALLNSKNDGDVNVDAGGQVVLNDSRLLSGDHGVTVSAGGAYLAENTTIDTNEDISLTAGDRFLFEKSTVKIGGDWDAGTASMVSTGEMSLNNTAFDVGSLFGGGSLTATLNRGSATLFVDGAKFVDDDNTLMYSPAGVTVVGTPVKGTVST